MMIVNRKTVIAGLSVLFVCLSILAHAADGTIATLRSETTLNVEADAPRISEIDNSDRRQTRNYPEQPPVIPHDITSYRIDLNSNKCLSCHARSRTGDSGAPMVSITHFMDAEGQFRAAVTPRRYFCTQCHVPQYSVKALIENTFTDIDTVLQKKK